MACNKLKRGKVAERTGLEPATSGVTGRHSNQLNYRSAFLNHYRVQKLRIVIRPAAKRNAFCFEYRGGLRLQPRMPTPRLRSHMQKTVNTTVKPRMTPRATHTGTSDTPSIPARKALTM